MDRDGRMDIVVGHSDQMVSVFRNAGSGSFEPFSGSPYETAAPLFNVVAGDVNDDGQMDLVIPTVRHVTVLLGGLPGFTPAAGSPFPAGLGTYNLAVADLNGDGRMDIAATDFEGDGLFILLGQK